MTVTFEMPVAARPVSDFLAPPVPPSGLVDGKDRRHREVLAALAELAAAVEELPAPQVTVTPTPGPDLTVAAALLHDGIASALAEQRTLTTEALEQITERLKALSRQIVASAGGGSGGGGNVTVLNDASNPAFVTLTNTSLVVDTGDGVALDVSVATATVTPASPLVVTPAAGMRLRVWWTSALADPDNSSTGRVTATLVGKGEIYRSFAIGHRQRFDGSTNGTLTVASPDAGTYEVTVHYQEVA